MSSDEQPGTAGEADTSVEPATDREHGAAAAVPPDYVVLQPLTFDLLARQLDRLGVQYSRTDTRILALWDLFSMTIRVIDGNVLAIRAAFQRTYTAEELPLIAGICNTWNSSSLFLKASATITLRDRDSPDDDAETSRIAVTTINLDLDLPCRVGIAPVQIQSLLSETVNNLQAFVARTQLGMPAQDPN